MRNSLPIVGGVAGRIRRYLKRVKEGKLFSTRDLLGFGKRGAVDQATRRMVDRGQLQRVARGVFCKISTRNYTFTPNEVAYVKARAFGKDPAKISHRRQLQIVEIIGVKERSLAVCNSSSSFLLSDRTKVELQRLAHRKIRLGDTHAGVVSRAHWAAGSGQCRATDEDFPQRLMQQLGTKAADELFDQFRLLPAWLNDCLAFYRLQKPRFADP